jgi:hypothetical protein
LASVFFGLGPVDPLDASGAEAATDEERDLDDASGGRSRLGAGLRYRCKRFSGNTLA